MQVTTTPVHDTGLIVGLEQVLQSGTVMKNQLVVAKPLQPGLPGLQLRHMSRFIRYQQNALLQIAVDGIVRYP